MPLAGLSFVEINVGNNGIINATNSLIQNIIMLVFPC